MKHLKLPLTMCAALACASAAFADSFTFQTPTGATDTALEPVDATATFTTNANGTLSISLTNLIVNQTSVGQNISDLFFTLDSTATSGSITTDGLDNLVSVAANGTATSAGTGTAGWTLSFDAATMTFHLDGLNGATFVPAHTILGAPDASGVYSNANPSIAGNGPHNPFIDQTATWLLTIPGIDSDTVVTGATFSFGTVSGDNVPGVPGVGGGPGGVPDTGSTLMFMSFGLAGLGFLRRKILA